MVLKFDQSLYEVILIADCYFNGFHFLYYFVPSFVCSQLKPYVTYIPVYTHI